MIHLDTNYLIGLLVKRLAAALEVEGWRAAGESFPVVDHSRNQARHNSDGVKIATGGWPSPAKDKANAALSVW